MVLSKGPNARLSRKGLIGGFRRGNAPSPQPVYPRTATPETDTLLFAGHSFTQTGWGGLTSDGYHGGILYTDWPGATLSDFVAFGSAQQVWELNGNLRNSPYDVVICSEVTTDFENGFPSLDSASAANTMQYLYWYGQKAAERNAEQMLLQVWSPDGASHLDPGAAVFFEGIRRWLIAKLGRPVWTIPAGQYVAALRAAGYSVYTDGLHLHQQFGRGLSYMEYSMLTQKRCPFVRAGDEAIDEIGWNILQTYECAGMGGTTVINVPAYTDPLPNPIPLEVPTITVTGGTITPFSRDGVDYFEIAMPAGTGSLSVSEPVPIRWALGGAGPGGAKTDSSNVAPGGGGAGQLLQDTSTLATGEHSFSLSVGGAGRSTVGPGLIGSPSIWTQPDGSQIVAQPGGYGGGYSTAAGETNRYAGGPGGGGGMTGGSATYPGGAAHSNGYPGASGFHSATAVQRAGGGGAGAGAPGQDGTSGTGGNGGDGVLLDWVASPIWVCGGGAGGAVTHGAPGRGGATMGVTNASSQSATWGGAAGVVRISGTSGRGGDAFWIGVVRASDANVDLIPPQDADFSRVSYWGSSSAEYSGSAFNAMIAGFGVTGIAQGKASERFEETGARIGVAPWSIIFPSDTIPASGTTVVTMTSGYPPSASALKPFSGRCNGVSGTLAWNASLMQLEFTRTTTGDAVPVGGAVRFIPDLTETVRRHPVVLWLAKNNLTSGIAPNSGEYAAGVHSQVRDWLLPTTKRAIVIGQFRNTGMAFDSAAGIRIDTANALLSDGWGRAFVDTVAWMRDDATWTRLGLTKTATDIAELALGNLPPSLAANGTDPQHFSAAAYADLINNVLAPRMIELGWYS